MINKKVIKPIVEQSLESLEICGQAYRQQLDYLLIHLDIETLTPLIKRLVDARDVGGIQQLETLLRKIYSDLIVGKNTLNKELLAKDIELNPAIGIQLQKIIQSNQSNTIGERPRYK